MTIKEGFFERENRPEKKKEKEEENTRDKRQEIAKAKFSKGVRGSLDLLDTT